MFTVPAPPVPGHPGAPGTSLPSAQSLSPTALPTSNPKHLAVRTRSIGTNTQDGGIAGALEGDSACLGPCQPGTSVNLQGIIWHETEEGVLVVNVTWRKRTYVGTLLDCTKHDWAPPRFCESPSSDPELPGGRGRGKRMRMAMAERPCVEPAPAAKVRGLSQHRSRGGGVSANAAPIHNKGRRGSLNLINSNCRAPSFFTVEEVKPANSTASLSSGKRKNKPPADLDLSLVSSEEIKNGNGKRIRAKSRSAPTTPQGKSDPSFMDPGGGCASSPPPPPILIDCPHPNCTKRYKHINGLRYHQTHAHLEVEEPRKPEIEAMKDGESEERLSDCEDAINNVTYDLSETNNSTNANSSSKKPAPLYKVTTVGSPKNRRLLLSTNHSPTANSKTRRTSLLKDGLIDDLSNLPIISNMTVVLENCMVPDRNSSVEMPKLEAEGLIEKKGGTCDKGKKANGKVEKLSKSRTNRPIAPAPAPPKLIAIPNTVYPTSTADTVTSQQPSPMAAAGLTSKNIPLKPIKPKLSIVVEPSLVKATLVTCSKETRKKEKRRLKDKHNKDEPIRTPNGDSSGIKMEDGGGGSKMGVKEISGSLLKEHLSKHDVMNGLTESQESRMASIRAEADKVYTFTDNAPSPSIGGSLRLDASGTCLATTDSGSKKNSPAYSDISDAGDDGGSSECRSDGLRSKSGSSASSEVSSSSNHGNSSKTPTTAAAPQSKDPQSPYYHSYEPYYLQGYMQSDRHNSSSSAFHKSSPHDCKGKDRKEEMKENDKNSHEFSDSKKGDGPPQSQLQLAMSQTQTALAQSLYYGQYSRGLYMDQKLLLASKCCDQTASAKQRGQGVRDNDDVKHIVGGSAGGPIVGKGPDGAKGCCPKPVLPYVEMSERGERGQSLGVKAVHGGMVEQHHVSKKDCDEIKSPTSSSSSSLHNPNSQTDLDSNVSFSSPSDSPAWSHRLAHSKYSDLQSQHGEEAEEGEADSGKEWGDTMELAGAKMTSGGGIGGGMGPDAKKARVHVSHDLLPAIDMEDSERLDGLEDQGQEPMEGLSEESQSARVAVSPPMTPQQPYIQYQHSSYPPYLALCESGGGSYRGVSPTLVHNYPGFHYPLYGKTAGREESEVTLPGRGGEVSSNQSSDSSSSAAIELQQQQSHQYHGKSPAPGEKGSPERDRETERERNHVSFARHLHTHHHTHLGMSYNLMSGQYDIYQGLSSRSLVSSQQVSGHSSTGPCTRKVAMRGSISEEAAWFYDD
ncbi:zinc finger protein 608 isoform X3 [Embiotoca jacksoni]